MRESVFETLIGFGVLVVASVFLWFTLSMGGEASTGSERVEMGVRFNSASGIDRGTDVRMAGVKVGTVRKIDLGVARAGALVTLAVDTMLLPVGDGTTARVQSEGLLGGSYINLEPSEGFGEIVLCGKDEPMFGESACSEILFSQGSIDLVTLMASFAQGSGSSDDASGGSSSDFEGTGE